MAPKIDMSKPHPKPLATDFHRPDRCAVCQGSSTPDAVDQARHAAYVELRRDELLGEHKRKLAEHEAHEAELARRAKHQEVFGFPAPLTREEIAAQQTPASRLLTSVLFGEEPADADVAAVRAQAAEDAAAHPARVARAKLDNRRQRIKAAILALPADARDAIDELRAQLTALDAEAAQAGQKPTAAKAAVVELLGGEQAEADRQRERERLARIADASADHPGATDALAGLLGA
ncbi:MAG: hypothetical protein IT370_09375 [Deltaproteobacteria bacterium]|nr:hypothetical protein [Deltaproteobacteria bacterium]